MKLNLKKLTTIMATGLLTACMLTVGAVTDSYITETVSVSAEDVIPEGYKPIYTFEDLNEVRNNLSGKYILMNDIDMTELTAPGGDWDMNGTGWEPIGTSYDNAFEGIFDGNGHKIIGMNIHGEVQYSYVGLFGCVGNGGSIKNLGIVDCDIDVSGNVSYIGAISGFMRAEYGNTIIYNSFVTGNITADNGYADVGGIAGYCYGDYWKSELYNCYSNMYISVKNTSENTNAGGISGYISDDVKLYNCYNTGKIEDISGAANIGAIYGEQSVYLSGYPINCYYLNGTCEGQESIAGKCAGLSVAQMKSQSAFTNWDFENTWIIDSTSGYKYPQLRSCMQVPVTEMTITSAPTKTTYVQGEKLSLTGGKVSVYHESDGSKGELDITESMLGAYDMNVIGKQSIPVNYINCSTTFDITINPPAVTNLLIDSVTENSVSLSWNKVKNAKGYIIYRYNITEDKWEKISRTTKTSYTDSTVDLTTEYKYAISSYLTISDVDYISEKSIVNKPIDLSETQISIDDILMSDVKASDDGYVLVKPEVYYNGTLLVEGTDYDITDGDYQVDKVGEYTVVLSGKGKFSGDVSVDFKVICEHSLKHKTWGECTICGEITEIIDINDTEYTVSDLYLDYYNQDSALEEKIIYKGVTLTEGTDYVVGAALTYIEDNRYSVEITGIGCFKNSFELEFNIICEHYFEYGEWGECVLCGTYSYYVGDANLDGDVNVRDCAFIASKLAQGLSDELYESADFNEDGKVNVRDAAAIASALASGYY